MWPSYLNHRKSAIRQKIADSLQLSDIYFYPTDYPEIRNVTGYINHCDKGTQCERQPHPEQYMWFDELHPSEQTDKIIADQFVETIEGKSRWAWYW